MALQGLVGFFDILGYQNIIDNNTIDEVSEIISQLLLKLPDDARVELTESLAGEGRESLRNKMKELKARMISDSILLVFPVDVKEGRLERLKYFTLFKAYVDRLLTYTFIAGLPMRGAIDFGEYFLEEDCFAGKPIINCFRLGQSLDFSGCVMTEGCREAVLGMLDGMVREGKHLDASFFGYDYLCPLRGQGYKKSLLLSWGSDMYDDRDIRQTVFEAFKDHNKDIGADVVGKIANTEMMIRFFKMKRRAKKLNALAGKDEALA
jgi:hypothetical protein